MLLTHAGLVCSVGLNAVAACAAMRAGIAGFADLPYFDNAGEPIVGAAVPGLPPDRRADERLTALLEAALRQSLTSSAIARTQSMPLLIGLAESGRPGGGGGLAESLVQRLEKKLNRKFHPEFSRCLASGHTAGLELLDTARGLLRDQDVPACLVAGADSLLSAATLDWLNSNDRLKHGDNSDGLIPGEAAAAVVVFPESDRRNLAPAAELVGLGFGQEKATVMNDEPLRGDGLAAAAKAALGEAQSAFHDIDFRLSDVTGESYGFKEQALLQGKLMRQSREEQPLWHAADSIGDTGAAAGLVHCIVAAASWQKKYAPGPIAACFASSVHGQRAACILRNPYTPQSRGASESAP